LISLFSPSENHAKILGNPLTLFNDWLWPMQGQLLRVCNFRTGVAKKAQNLTGKHEYFNKEAKKEIFS